MSRLCIESSIRFQQCNNNLGRIVPLARSRAFKQLKRAAKLACECPHNGHAERLCLMPRELPELNLDHRRGQATAVVRSPPLKERHRTACPAPGEINVWPRLWRPRSPAGDSRHLVDRQIFGPDIKLDIDRLVAKGFGQHVGALVMSRRGPSTSIHSAAPSSEGLLRGRVVRPSRIDVLVALRLLPLFQQPPGIALGARPARRRRRTMRGWASRSGSAHPRSPRASGPLQRGGQSGDRSQSSRRIGIAVALDDATLPRRRARG
jgi:hypothetical protein